MTTDFFSDAGPATTPRQEPALEEIHLQRVRELVQAHLGAPLPISRLSRETGHSPGHFVELFKKATGVSPHRFVLLARLKRAATMLAHTDISISQIARDCGFPSQERMSKLFGMVMETTPSDYRRRYRKSR